MDLPEPPVHGYTPTPASNLGGQDEWPGLPDPPYLENLPPPVEDDLPPPGYEGNTLSKVAPSEVSSAQKRTFSHPKVLLCFTILLAVGFNGLAPIYTFDEANPQLVCKASCIAQNCSLPLFADYILPTPAIGISVGEWSAITAFLTTAMAVSLALSFVFKVVVMRIIVLGTTGILYLAFICWISVGTQVYAQTFQMCTDHGTGVWTIDSELFTYGFVMLLLSWMFIGQQLVIFTILLLKGSGSCAFRCFPTGFEKSNPDPENLV
jgi:hypothetical protein